MATRRDRLDQFLRGLIKEARDEIEDYEGMLESGCKRKSSKRTGKSSKPCCTKNEVIEVFTILLTDNETLTPDELEGLAKDKLQGDLGKSLSGFAMRQREALSDPRFVMTQDGDYRLQSIDQVRE